MHHARQWARRSRVCVVAFVPQQGTSEYTCKIASIKKILEEKLLLWQQMWDLGRTGEHVDFFF